jgi:hypothetical protein
MTSKQTFLVGGLPVNVFTSSTTSSSEKPVLILFMLHGRLETAEGRQYVVDGLFKDYPTGLERDLVVVTFVSKLRSMRASYKLFHARTKETMVIDLLILEQTMAGRRRITMSSMRKIRSSNTIADKSLTDLPV